MKTRVVAVIVARQAGEHLARTLASVQAQTRRPDLLIAVDASPKQAARDQLQACGPSAIVRVSPRASLGEALTAAAPVIPAVSDANDLLWFLAHDSAPVADALELLIRALEVAPSVAVAGPAQMCWDDPDRIEECGLTLTPSGSTVPWVHDELDQGQHDDLSDMMAVGARGMLVRQHVWAQLGGFDPHLTSVDDALDFCVRARLAGHRVVVVPQARVAVEQHTPRARQYRTAALYRRLVYASGFLAVVLWLRLIPMAFWRSLVLLVAKRPGQVGAEYAAAIATTFSLGAVARARRRLRATKTASWSSVKVLRMSRAEVRRRAALAREAALMRAHGERVPIHFISGGGAWIALILSIVSIVALAPLIGAAALSGGALLPLEHSVPQLWSQVTFGWREGAFAVVGPADAFSQVVATLGSLTWWNPTYVLVVMWFVALPMAGVGAWFVMARFTQRASIRVLAAMGYALAPTLLSALNEGRPAAVIVHLTLPWLIFAAIWAVRSWSASAVAALLFAVVVACAPSLAPALLIMWAVTVAFSGRAIGRFVAIPLPALVLMAPVVVMQILSGSWQGMLADPGPAVPSSPAPAWQIALGFPVRGLGGLDFLTDAVPGVFPGTTVTADIAALVLVGVLVALAFIGFFSTHPLRAQLAVGVALLGVATGILASGVAVAFDGSSAVPLWAGSGLSLAWLGVIVAAATGASVLKKYSVISVSVGLVAIVALAVPSLLAPAVGASLVRAGDGTTLPAYVVAHAASDQRVGTLVLTPQQDGGLGVSLVRGTGLTLDSVSTYVQTGGAWPARADAVSTLAANLVSQGEQGVDAQLRAVGIGYVLLAPPATGVDEVPSPLAQAMTVRVRSTLDSSSVVESVGLTRVGVLWRFPGYDPAAMSAVPSGVPIEPWRGIIGSSQLVVILLTALLAIPTGSVTVAPRSRRRAPAPPAVDDEPFVDALAGDDDEN
jgi:GT2 family glycosyltransferase